MNVKFLSFDHSQTWLLLNSKLTLKVNETKAEKPRRINASVCFWVSLLTFVIDQILKTETVWNVFRKCTFPKIWGFFFTKITSFNRDVVHITNQNVRLLIVCRLLIIMKRTVSASRKKPGWSPLILKMLLHAGKTTERYYCFHVWILISLVINLWMPWTVWQEMTNNISVEHLSIYNFAKQQSKTWLV